MHMRAKDVLHVMYSNVCEPFKQQSLRRNIYFVSFVDECSRMIWLYFIKPKCDVFSIFKKFKLMVERQNGMVLKILRTNGGGEYMSREFKNYCIESGIR